MEPLEPPLDLPLHSDPIYTTLTVVCSPQFNTLYYVSSVVRYIMMYYGLNVYIVHIMGCP